MAITSGRWCAAVVACVFMSATGSTKAMAAELVSQSSGVAGGTGVSLATMLVGGGSGGLAPAGTRTSSLGSFAIQINPGSGLAGNAAALAAFNRGAQQWANFIADPITVYVNADLTNMGSTTIIGSAGSTLLVGSYTEIRDQMVVDAADEADDGVMAWVPTAANFSAYVPMGFSLTGEIVATKANLKAMGFAGLDADFGQSDGNITFNSMFSFDYDRSDGITPGTVDFQTVVAHELGHILGFISAVDDVDYYVHQSQTHAIDLNPLDLLRFTDNVAGRDPATLAEFAAYPRNLVPGQEAVFDTIVNQWRLSTGDYAGDGNQASHWKDNAITGQMIGMMDPTLGSELTFPMTFADQRAMDLIGYDILTPEPAAGLVLVVAGICLLARRR